MLKVSSISLRVLSRPLSKTRYRQLCSVCACVRVCAYSCIAFADRSKGSKYNGTVNRTISGRTCQRWDSEIPHKHRHHGLAAHENYCRDPDMNGGFPWCYTTDPNQPTEFCLISAKQGEQWWQFCNLTSEHVQFCNMTNCATDLCMQYAVLFYQSLYAC